MKLEESQPATLGAVVDAVTRIGLLGEAKILEMVSAGKLKELFPFKPSLADVPPDAVEEGELTEASPMPLSRERRASLIQSSMPATYVRSVKAAASKPKGSRSRG